MEKVRGGGGPNSDYSFPMFVTKFFFFIEIFTHIKNNQCLYYLNHLKYQSVRNMEYSFVII